MVFRLKVVLWLGALAPAVWLGTAFYLDMFGTSAVGVSAFGPGLDVTGAAGAKLLTTPTLGANPIEKLTHVTGMTTLVLLLITLSVTPIRRLTGWNRVIKLRRQLGLFAFFYAFSHFSIWAGLDQTLVWSWMLEDIVERPYITLGFVGLVILIPLAITSTTGWIRRLGKRWTLLHRGIYVAATLGVIHFYWLVKADVRLPILFAVILGLLMSARVVFSLQKRRKISPSKISPSKISPKGDARPLNP
jgi:sulfoxide reductase heme-binding subunit YedZ